MLDATDMVQICDKNTQFSFMHIIARYNEDLSYWDNIEPKFIVQKGYHLSNRGREASSYLWYIINNYEDLEGLYSFRQCNPYNFDGSLHPIGVFDQVNYKNGWPHDNLPYLNELISVLGLDIPGDVVYYSLGAQFDVSAEKILRHPVDYYIKLYNLCMSDRHEVDRLAWCMERLWKYVFNL